MNILKRLFVLFLTVCMFVTCTVVASAAEDELYLADLRIVYAEDYEEAQKILQNTEFKDYTLLNYNLNATATKVDLGLITIGDSNGVFLAYKTTTNVDEAITDVAIMQMNGGYRDGNYQEMVEKSRKQYEAVGETYKTAIDYLIEGYMIGDFLATSAYRQLELYYDDDSGMSLGTFFETQPGADILATMFLEGNRYVMQNVRSLIAMGVSYNDDGMTYLEKVSEAALEMDDDPTVFDEEELDDLAQTISDSIVTFREMLLELSTIEGDLDYEDSDYTNLELTYAEHEALAEMLRATTYLDGETLYDFCLSYYKDENDYSKLYPLAYALNVGQRAVTVAGNYYDAVRYSMSELPIDFMNDEIAKIEEVYFSDPFSIYTGVDRSIYEGTFALTTDAYRADVSSDKGFFSSVYGLNEWQRWGMEIATGSIGAGLFTWAILRTKDMISNDAAAKVYEAALQAKEGFNSAIDYMTGNISYTFPTGLEPSFSWAPPVAWEASPTELIDKLLTYCPPKDFSTVDVSGNTSLFIEKLNYVNNNLPHYRFDDSVLEALDDLSERTQAIVNDFYACDGGARYGDALPMQATATGIGSKLFTVGLYAFGAAMMAYAAYSYGSQVYNYYNPTYKDIPVSMIDLVVTDDGDRYVKYDAVTMVEMNESKGYDPADLNAFSGQRWNALYITKSYEAGKPLLASSTSFKVVTNNNVAPDNHLAVHRFGESVCYDLNKYNFDYEDSIYLSIAQSENQKSAVSDVPTIVGSMLGNGLYFLTAGLGIAAGVGATLGAQYVLNKKKQSDPTEGEPVDPDEKKDPEAEAEATEKTEATPEA